MRILHHEAILDEEYCDEYYSPFHQIMNHGGLCLISKPYFNFASCVMKKICSIVNVEKLRNERQEFLSSVKDKFFNDDELFKLFCSVDLEKFDNSFHLCELEKKDIFTKILSTTIHAKSGAILKQFREENLGNATDMALRQKLKASVAKSQVEKARELKTQKQKLKNN